MSKARIQDDLKQAMKARDKQRTDALRLITAAIKQIEVDERVEVDDDRLVQILTKMAKQRKESITQYQKANREDLIAQEQFELDIIATYLPEALSEEEINAHIEQAIASTGAETLRDMGKVMGQLKGKLQGRADMALVSSLIKAKLS